MPERYTADRPTVHLWFGQLRFKTIPSKKYLPWANGPRNQRRSSGFKNAPTSASAMSISAEPALDAATRIAAGDDGTNYDNVAIALHWATALLVVANFALAETWDWFAKPTKDLMEDTHMSFGVLLAAVILTRLVWRLIPGHQMSSLEAGWVRLASKGTH